MTLHNLLILAGDKGVDIAVRGDIDDLDATIVAVTTNGDRLSEIRLWAQKSPIRHRYVILNKPPAADDGWDDPAMSPPRLTRFRHSDRSLYASGDAQGACSRSDACFRLIANHEFERELDAIVGGLVGQDGAGAEITVPITIVATCYRCSGSAVPHVIAGMAQAAAARYGAHATFLTQAVLATRSIALSGERDRRLARAGRTAALAEFLVAEQFGVELASGITLQPGNIGHIYETGAPPRHQGLLRTEAEVRKANALIIRSILSGQTGAELSALQPHTLPVRYQRRTDTTEVLRFSGLGGLEVRYEPALAAEYVARWVASGVDSVPGDVPALAFDVVAFIRGRIKPEVGPLLARAYDSFVPAPDHIPHGIDVGATIRQRTGTLMANGRALADAVASETVGQIRDLANSSRATGNPFSFGVYEAAVAALAGFAPKSENRVTGAIDDQLNKDTPFRDAVRALDGASKRHIRRVPAIRSASQELAKQGKLLQLALAGAVEDFILTTAAIAVRSTCEGTAQTIESAQEELELYLADREARDDELTATALACGRTSEDHPFAVPPSTEIILRYAARTRTELFVDNDGLDVNQAAFWSGFGRWLAENGCRAPEEGGQALRVAFQSFCLDGIGRQIFVEPSLRALYDGVGELLPIQSWVDRAVPRVLASRAVAPVRTDIIVEAPADLVVRPEWAGIAGLRQPSPSGDPSRIVFLTVSHGLSLGDLLRAEGGAIEDIIKEIVEAASTPVLAEAMREHLPELLGVPSTALAPGASVPVRSGIERETGLPTSAEPVSASRQAPAGVAANGTAPASIF